MARRTTRPGGVVATLIANGRHRFARIRPKTRASYPDGMTSHGHLTVSALDDMAPHAHEGVTQPLPRPARV